MGLLLNIAIGYPIAFGIGGFKGFGFASIPIVTVAVQIFDAIMLVVIAHARGDRDTVWAFCHLNRETFTYPRLKEYLTLWTPAVATIALDTWRFNLVGGIVVWRLGDLDVAAF